MEILFWLLPPVVVTLVAMVWVSWLGREGRGEVDRDVAVRRLTGMLARKGYPAGVCFRVVREELAGLGHDSDDVHERFD